MRLAKTAAKIDDWRRAHAKQEFVPGLISTWIAHAPRAPTKDVRTWAALELRAVGDLRERIWSSLFLGIRAVGVNEAEVDVTWHRLELPAPHPKPEWTDPVQRPQMARRIQRIGARLERTGSGLVAIIEDIGDSQAAIEAWLDETIELECW